MPREPWTSTSGCSTSNIATDQRVRSRSQAPITKATAAAPPPIVSAPIKTYAHPQQCAIGDVNRPCFWLVDRFPWLINTILKQPVYQMVLHRPIECTALTGQAEYWGAQCSVICAGLDPPLPQFLKLWELRMDGRL